MPYFVYITASKNHTVLYTGVTNDLKKRIAQHQQKLVPGFTKKYHVDKLVYFEMFDGVNDAIAREKQIKGGSRQKKLDLIRNVNKKFTDLTAQL